MSEIPDASPAVEIDAVLVALRPRLHRYCARMVGSVIDGEDVLQDALIKAVEALAATGPVGNPEGWLFRIAHNTALDFLRRRNRQQALYSVEEVDMMPDQLDPVTSRQIASASLRTFMRLTVTQRSTGAAAEGRAFLTATGAVQQWEVETAAEGGATFEAGPATAVAFARNTVGGKATDAHQWLVNITLVME